MRSLITGGTGFVGRHLVSFLQGKSSHIAVLASGGCKGAISEAECFEVDIRDADQVRHAMHGFRPTHIYHLAAISAVPLSWKFPRATYETNVFGTLNVLDAAATLPSPARVLNVSTAQVYRPSKSAIDEKSPVGPENPYAASKAMAELLRVQYRKEAGGGIITARSFNHAGPGQSPDFVVSSIAKQFAEIEAGLRPPQLKLGNVAVRRDFTDVRDVVRAYWLLLEKGSPNDIYNVCSGRSHAIREIVALFETISGVQVNVGTNPDQVRAVDIDEICGDPSKLRSATGWTAEIPLESTLVDVLNYWRGMVGHQHHAPRSSPEENDVYFSSAPLRPR